LKTTTTGYACGCSARKYYRCRPAQCFHGKGTEGLSIRQLGTYSSRRVYYIVRNRWLFLLKNFSLRTLVLLAPLLLIYDLAQLLISLKKGVAA